MKCGPVKFLISLTLGGVLSMLSTLGVAADSAILDCPLRDEPFSLRSPLMDILLSPAATAIVNKHMEGVLDKIPPTFASSEAPSFSAILTLNEVADMARLDKTVLDGVAKEFAGLEVTDADRAARCARYDNDLPVIAMPQGGPRLLVFEKMTGFRDGPSVEAAAATFRAMADKNGWAMVVTDRGGAMTPDFLAQFDAVIWNNVSGDVLTLPQRKSL